MSARTEYARKHGEFVSSGAFRDVYKAKHGKYVYKYDTFNNSKVGSNTNEWKTYQYLSENVTLPEGVRIPKMSFIDGVIIAEYIEGYHPTFWCGPLSHACNDVESCYATKMGSNFPVNDIKPDNILITNDGTVYVIDLGNGSSLVPDSSWD